jgi:hypothetical protein
METYGNWLKQAQAIMTSNTIHGAGIFAQKWWILGNLINIGEYIIHEVLSCN